MTKNPKLRKLQPGSLSLNIPEIHRNTISFCFQIENRFLIFLF